MKVVGVWLAFVDGLADGELFATPVVELPVLLSTYAPPPPSTRSNTTTMAAGTTQRGRPDGIPPSSSLFFFGAGFLAGAGAGARGIGGAVTGAGPGVQEPV